MSEGLAGLYVTQRMQSDTGIPESDQVTIRQTLMLEGVLRLSVVGTAWTYQLEAQS